MFSVVFNDKANVCVAGDPLPLLLFSSIRKSYALYFIHVFNSDFQLMDVVFMQLK